MIIRPPELSYVEFCQITQALCYHFYGVKIGGRPMLVLCHYFWTEGFTPDQAAEEINDQIDKAFEDEMRDREQS